MKYLKRFFLVVVAAFSCASASAQQNSDLGAITSSAPLTAAQVIAALGYTPAAISCSTSNGIVRWTGTAYVCGPATTDGTGNITIPTSAQLLLPLGSNSLPAIKAAGAATGLYWRNISALDFVFSSTTSFEFDVGGLFSLGGTSAGLSANGTNVTGAAGDAYFLRLAAANWQLGNIAVDTNPVAQTLSVQNVLVGGTSNVAGANFTIAGSQGKGTGVGGSLVFQVAPAGSAGTTVNALVTALTVDSTKLATFAGQLNVPAMTQTSAAQTGTVCYNNGAGAVTYDATLGCLTSSARFKTDIVDIRRPEALALTMALAPVSFRKRTEFGGDVDPSYQVGFIAEQVADVDERLIARGEDGLVRGVRYQQMTAVLAGAIQELDRKILLLEARH